jgi:hypothetical protein
MKKLLLYLLAALILSPAVNAEPKPVAKNLTTVLAEKVVFGKKKPKRNKKRKASKGPRQIH